MIRKFLIFTLGEEEFGIGIKDVVEILKAQKIHNLPELPDFISGIMTLRGNIIPLIDMRRRFGIKPSPKKERIVVIKTGREKVGIIVDEVKEITGLGEEEIDSPPSIFKGLKTEYLEGIGKKKDRVVILLAIENIISAEERIMLKESKAVMEKK